MATYTTDDLITSVLNRAQLPSSSNNNNVNSDANLLKLGTEEIYTKLLPLILSTREEWYVAPYNHTITANQSAYAMPPRASGRVLRDVLYVLNGAISRLDPIDPETLTTELTGEPSNYYIEDDNVVLYPTPATTTGTLRLRYFRRPNRLADTADCVQITAINTSTGVVTVSAVPTTFGTTTLIDMIKNTSPFTTLGMDYSITATSSTTVTFASLPTGLAVGDWMALAEYTPIPQIPQEFFPVLAQMMVVKVLEAYGDREGAAAAYKDLDVIRQNALVMISPRTVSKQKKIIGRNW